MSYYPPERQPTQPRRRRRGFSGWKIRLLIAGAIILFSAISYYSTSSPNVITGEKQRVSMTAEQEIDLGRNAAYEMVQQFGGMSRNQRAASHVQMIGERLENALYQRLQRDGIKLPYPFDFHLLADRNIVNAFALPGGQIFMTEALYSRLTHEGQLAGVLGHEVGHVLERHGAENMESGRLFQSIAGAAGVAAGDMNSSRLASAALSVVQKGYGRQAELEADRWGVELMTLIGFNPNHMLELMDILKDAEGTGGVPPEFLSSHPKPENRQKYIREVIAEKFPEGLPPGLK